MRLNFYHILSAFAFFVCVCACSTPIYAQDGGFPINETYDADPDYSDIPAPSGEGESRLNAPKVIPASLTVSKDSAASSRLPAQRHHKLADKSPENTKAASKEKGSRKQQEDDDSILSFNFLYYIFQKYKLQDIVD